MSHCRARDRARLASETAEERESRLSHRRARLASDTTEERDSRLSHRRTRLASETAEERESRSSHCRARNRARLASERESSLSRERAQRAARSSLTSETRLMQMRSVERRNLPTRERPGTTHENSSVGADCLRDTRGDSTSSTGPHNSSAGADCLRDTRGDSSSSTARQQERIASVTPEETAARRQRDREAHSYRPPPASAQPLLHQPAVQRSFTPS